MNRIILIGNGFDLAHNMKTSYSHFINDFWEKVMQKLQNEVNGNITSYLTTFETEEIEIINVPGGPYNAGDWVKGSNYVDLETKSLQALIQNNLRHHLI